MNVSFPTNPDVIVIGAGAAGLAAAKDLRDAGLDVIVVEAADHVGGRCVTDTGTFPVPFDRGGSWLHSATINPLARIAESNGVTLHKSPWIRERMHVAGKLLAPDAVAAFEQFQPDMWAAINVRGKEHPDTTTREAMPPCPWPDTAACAIAQMLGGDADVTSAQDSSLYADAEGDWLVAGGLGAFVRDLHQSVPVKTGCKVDRIDWSGRGITAETSHGVLHAPQAVVTVSTGVLSSGAIRFFPDLPDAKLEALDDLPNGLLNKVGIGFDPNWTEAREGDMADYHAGGDAFCSVLFGFFGTGLATAFLAGRCADALEQDGPGAATDFAREAIRAMFGQDVMKYIRKTDETAWRGNPLTQGSYSFARPGGALRRRDLAAPLAGRLFFAGEATSQTAYSTVHGAWQSGRDAARDILAARGINTGHHT